jgi:hypothetical protein
MGEKSMGAEDAVVSAKGSATEPDGAELGGTFAVPGWAFDGGGDPLKRLNIDGPGGRREMKSKPRPGDAGVAD